MHENTQTIILEQLSMPCESFDKCGADPILEFRSPVGLAHGHLGTVKMDGSPVWSLSFTSPEACPETVPPCVKDRVRKGRD